jgi:acid stress-induced BolA-like protein IbaG/YrbA
MELPEIIENVRQKVVLDERIKELTDIQNDIKKVIREGVAELGVENENGHIVVAINDEVSGVKNVMQQRKVSKSLDIEVAEDILKEKGIHEKCIKMIPVLDEDEIMSAYYEGTITEEDIDKMFPAKISWALVMPKA